MTVLVEAKKMTRSLGSLVAVKDVSFEIKQGSVVGFLGPNGAGKSTTMRLLTGYLQSDSGTASIAGFDISADTLRARAQLGYLPEAATGFPNLTVREFLKYCGECRGWWGKDLEIAIDRVCDETKLTASLNQTIRTLSKGWRQRAWFAQAMLHNPPVLILDEPTDGLDPNQKSHVRNLIRSIAQHKAILFSTHILEEAEEICDRVIIIANGQIVADGTPKKLSGREGRLAPVFQSLTQPQTTESRS